MKLTSRVISTVTTILAVCCLSACNSIQTIPAVNESNIDEAAKTLGVSTDRLEAFFDNIDISYDNYINKLNSKNQTLAALKTNIETNYDCTFGEYIETVITVNNKTIPDAKKYDAFKSNLSVFDVYIRSNELNDNKNKLINYDVEIQSADTDNDVYAFDIIANCGNDFRNYVDIMNENYGCKSVELTNIAIFGGHGVKKPKEGNPCMDKLFAYDDKTDEILEKLTLSVLTMHYDNDNDNVTFALSNELGLIFKATGSDSETKILNLGNIDFQIRKATSEN